MATLPAGRTDEGHNDFRTWERSSRDDVLRLEEDRIKAAAGDELIRTGRVIVAGAQPTEPEPPTAPTAPRRVVKEREPPRLPPTRAESIREATRQRRKHGRW